MTVQAIPRKPPPSLTPELREKVIALIMAADRHKIPPVYVTAHVRYPAADTARHEVMRTMITELGLRRWQVAYIFNRDVRRVRKSVLGV